MIAWFTRNDVAANLLLMLIVFAGVYSLKTSIPVEIFPTIATETVSVSVSLRGSTPEEVEQSVSIRIEEAVQDLEGIEKISSRSAEGSASVTIKVESGYDARELLNDIKSRVDAINTFPAEAENPIISLATRTREVISVAVSGNISEKEIRQQAERVRDELLRIPGITQLELEDVRDYEISIEVSEHQLREYQLQLSDIAAAVNNSSLDLSAGNIKTSGGEVLIRLKGQAYERSAFDMIVVKTSTDGSILRLKDVAQVRDGFSEDPLLSRFNGRPAAMIEVYRVGNQSAVDIADKVKAYVNDRQADLPQGVELGTWRDRSVIVKGRLQTLLNNAMQGGFLVLLLLTLFLRPSVALWVFIGVPVSFMGAFIFMPLFDMSLNIFSLFGFILVLGIVVDDAIVTGENVYRHLEHAEDGEQAAIIGTQEVAAPVTFGVLTTVAAFIPLTMIDGMRGALFAQIALVIIPILIFSLIESKFILPAHLKHIKINQSERGNRFSRWQQRFAKGFERGILTHYQPFLTKCLANRYATLVTFIGIFLVMLSLIMSGWSRFVFFPRVESETIRATLTMPAGTPFAVTDKYVVMMTEHAITLQNQYKEPTTGLPVIENILSSSGTSGRSNGTHYGRVVFEITSPEDRTLKISSTQLVNEWRKMIGDIPGAESIAYRAEIMHVGDPVDIQLSGNSFVELQTVADAVKRELASYPGVFDIADSMSDGKEELQLQLKPEAYALGINESDVIRQVREAFYGFEAQRIQRGRDDVRVMVRYPIAERSAIANLQDFLITTSDGRRIPVAQVVELIPGKSPTAIYRNDLLRTLNITADIDKGQVNMALVNSQMRVFIEDQLQQFPGMDYTLEGESKEQSDSFTSMMYGLVFIFFAIYSLLAIPFKSYLQPLIVMSIIPFGTIGAVLGHWILGMPLTMFSLLGIVALIGVVVNDSLVLVDFINQQRRKHGMPVLEAIQAAGAARFRPVMLTSMTTFFGLLPLLFEQSTQAQFLIPMAVSLAFGILFATLITLIMVPVNYMIALELKRLFSNKPLKFGSAEETSRGKPEASGL